MHGNLEVLCQSGHIPVAAGPPRIYLPVTLHPDAGLLAGLLLRLPTAVVHPMTQSASIIGHRRQVRTPRPRCIGFLVQSVRTIKPPRL